MLFIKRLLIITCVIVVNLNSTSSLFANTQHLLKFISSSLLNNSQLNSNTTNGSSFGNNYTKIVSKNMNVIESSFNNKKSVTGIDTVLIFNDSDSIIDPEQTKQIFKEKIELPRFYINEIIISNNKEIFKSVEKIDSSSVKELAKILSSTYASKIKSILEDPYIQKQRIGQFKEDSYTFKSLKGRSNSVTKKDLQILLNSAYIYIPYIQDVTLKKEKFLKKIDEDTYVTKTKVKLSITAGLLWYQIKINPNNKAEIVFVAQIKCSNNKEETYDGHSEFTKEIALLSTEILHFLGDSFKYATKSLKPFKIYAKVISSQKNNHVLQFPKAIPVSINDHFWLMENYESKKTIKSRKVGLAYIKSKVKNSKNSVKANARQVYGNNAALMSWVKDVPYMGLSIGLGYWLTRGFEINYRDAVINNSNYLFDKTITQAQGVGLKGAIDISRFLEMPMTYVDVGAIYYPISINYYNKKSPDSFMTQVYFNARKVFWLNQYGVTPFIGGASKLFEIKESDDYFYNMKSFGLLTGLSIEKMIRPFLSIEVTYQAFWALGSKSIENTINNDTYSKNAEYSKLNSNSISVLFKWTK